MLVNEPILNDAKPAVRGTVARKKEVDNLPQSDVSYRRTLLYSVTKNIIVPPTTSIIVIIMAITVFDVSVRALWSNMRRLRRKMVS